VGDGLPGITGKVRIYGDATNQTPHTVNLIRSAAFKNFPTNCAPPGSVPRCDAVGSAPGTKTGARRGS
jgi:hypothetical protein